MNNSKAHKLMSIRGLAGWEICLFATLLFLSQSIFADEHRKVRLGYFEGGKYPYHDRLKDEFYRQLEAILPDSIEAVFAPEGYRSAEWDKAKSSQMAFELAGVESIDLVIAAGPWVVKDLLDAGFKKPIIGMHQFAPQYEGLLNKKGKPVAENLTIHYQKNKIESDLTALAGLIKLKKLGFLYFPSSIEGDSVLAQARAVGVRLGFEVVTAVGENNKGTFALFNAYAKLDKKIDALYIGPMWACDIQMINQFLYNTDHDMIPVMTSEDMFLVDRGALLTNNAYGIYSEARFSAYKTAQIILGAKPGGLAVEFSSRPALAINEAAAMKNHISLTSSLYSEAYVVPAPPDQDVTSLTLSYAIGRAISFNPGDTAMREAIEKTVKDAKKEYDNLLAHDSTDSMRLAVSSLQTIISIENDLKSGGIEKINPERAPLELEQAVTKAFLNYLRAEEALKLEFRNRELIDRNIEVSHAKHFAEKADERDLIRWRAEREKSTSSIVEAQNNLKVAQILLDVLMNYPVEQKLSLEGERFNIEATQKLYGLLYQRLSEQTSRDTIAANLAALVTDERVQAAFQVMLTGFDNLAVASRRLNLELISLELAVSQYDGADLSMAGLLDKINLIAECQLSEISVRYGFYESMSDICALMGWSA
ncbi:MAG: ABC transporter substrate binding protein, partial [Candidatus Zixiibacteriota bacterium]